MYIAKVCNKQNLAPRTVEIGNVGSTLKAVNAAIDACGADEYVYAVFCKQPNGKLTNVS